MTTVDGSTVKEALEELERDADEATLDELLLEKDDCSTFLLDDEAFTLELDFTELLLDVFFRSCRRRRFSNARRRFIQRRFNRVAIIATGGKGKPNTKRSTKNKFIHITKYKKSRLG